MMCMVDYMVSVADYMISMVGFIVHCMVYMVHYMISIVYSLIFIVYCGHIDDHIVNLQWVKCFIIWLTLCLTTVYMVNYVVYSSI
jgi:hypothetical protein